MIFATLTFTLSIGWWVVPAFITFLLFLMIVGILNDPMTLIFGGGLMIAMLMAVIGCCWGVYALVVHFAA